MIRHWQQLHTFTRSANTVFLSHSTTLFPEICLLIALLRWQAHLGCWICRMRMCPAGAITIGRCSAVGISGNMPISSSMISIIWAPKLLNGRPPKYMNQRSVCGIVLCNHHQNMDGTLFSLAMYGDIWVTKLKWIRTCLIFSLSLSLHRPLREFSIFAAVYLSLPQQPAFALLAPAMPSRSVIAASRPMQQSHTGPGQKHQIGRSKSVGCTWLYQHFLLDQVYTRDLILDSLSFPGPPPVTCGAPWQPRQMVQLLKGWTVTCWKWIGHLYHSISILYYIYIYILPSASFIREHHELCTKMCSPPRPNLDLRTLSCTRSQQLALHIVCLTWGRSGPASPNVEGVTQCSNRMRMKAIMLEWGDRRVCVTCYNVCPLFYFHYGFFDNLVQ